MSVLPEVSIAVPSDPRKRPKKRVMKRVHKLPNSHRTGFVIKLIKKKFFPTPLRVVFHSSELCLVVDQGKEKKKKGGSGKPSLY